MSRQLVFSNSIKTTYRRRKRIFFIYKPVCTIFLPFCRVSVNRNPPLNEFSILCSWNLLAERLQCFLIIAFSKKWTILISLRMILWRKMSNNKIYSWFIDSVTSFLLLDDSTQWETGQNGEDNYTGVILSFDLDAQEWGRKNEMQRPAPFTAQFTCQKTFFAMFGFVLCYLDLFCVY